MFVQRGICYATGWRFREALGEPRNGDASMKVMLRSSVSGFHHGSNVMSYDNMREIKSLYFGGYTVRAKIRIPGNLRLLSLQDNSGLRRRTSPILHHDVCKDNNNKKMHDMLEVMVPVNFRDFEHS